MIQDMMIVLWKEIKELVFQRGRFRGGILGMLVFVGVFGVMMPLQTGPDWVNSPIGLVYWGWVPFLLVSGVVADSFAGERERHTLETLLSTRLSDRAILFGKIASALAYGWGITLFSAFLSVVTVNIAFASQEGRLLLYSPELTAAIILLSFLVSALSASLGVIVSLRASTVRQAQQTFSIAFFALFIPLFLIPVLPEDIKLKILSWAMNVDAKMLVVGLIGILFVVDIVLSWVAITRFKRARLILD
jgi:ABC-2 type transport system permease protein